MKTIVPLKRRKLVSSEAGNTGGDRGEEPARFPHMVLFLLERKMGSSRRRFLSQLGRRKGFQVEEQFR